MANRSLCKVIINGRDITSRLGGRLISIDITDNEGTHNDTCSITIDDADGVIVLPKTGDKVQVELARDDEPFGSAFEGTIDEVGSSCGRGQGRILYINAKGMDTQGKAKENQQTSIENATVKEALEKAGKAAGVTSIKVDKSFEKIKREWWGLNDESFIHFGERVAREVGGIFKIRGNTAILAAKTGGSPSGEEMPTINARWGVNLINWDIKPKMGRNRYREVKARWYDPQEAKWKEQKAQVRGDTEGVIAGMTTRYSRADDKEAEGDAGDKAMESEKQSGGGSIEVDGTASAKPGGKVNLIGARPGIDGEYRIKTVNHSYSRSGWTTKLDVQQPQGEAGKDTRKPENKGGGKSSGTGGTSGGVNAGGGSGGGWNAGGGSGGGWNAGG